MLLAVIIGIAEKQKEQNYPKLENCFQFLFGNFKFETGNTFANPTRASGELV
jgi:hypothetical protein